MELSVEISLYPLAQQEYEEQIWDFIKRIRQYPDIRIKTNGMSSQVFGEYHQVMNCLTVEMERVYQEIGRAVFVCKYIMGDRSHIDE